jgi:hypothetical protein
MNTTSTLNIQIKKQLVLLEDAFYDGIDNVITQHPDIRHFSTIMNRVLNNINNIIEQHNCSSELNTNVDSGNDNCICKEKDKNINYAQLEMLGYKK